MIAKGKVISVNKATDKVTEIVIRVKKDSIWLPVCFTSFDAVKALINQLGIEVGDRVKITYYLKSNKWNDKYYTTAVIEKIVIIEKKSIQYEVDLETGEISGYK